MSEILKFIFRYVHDLMEIQRYDSVDSNWVKSVGTRQHIKKLFLYNEKNFILKIQYHCWQKDMTHINPTLVTIN